MVPKAFVTEAKSKRVLFSTFGDDLELFVRIKNVEKNLGVVSSEMINTFIKYLIIGNAHASLKIVDKLYFFDNS